MADVLTSILYGVAGAVIWIPFCVGYVRRDRFIIRTMLVVGCYAGISLLFYPLQTAATTLQEIGWFAGLVLAGKFCYHMSHYAAIYTAVWATMYGEILNELVCLAGIFLLNMQLDSRELRLLCSCVFILLVLPMLILMEHVTSRAPMHSVGPRQTTCAVVLMLVNATMLVLLMHQMDTARSGVVYIMALFTQAYCITFLYFQNEVFRRVEMQKELDALTLLLDQKQRQYTQAQNYARLMNKYAHHLKASIAGIQAGAEGADREVLCNELQEAMDVYEDTLHTGNEALDIVLTEKKMLCRTHGITLSCIADGELLQNMKAADVYMMVSLLLDTAIDEVAAYQNEERRLIDVSVFKRQNFAAVQILYPLQDAMGEEEHAANIRKHKYALKTVKRIIESYEGLSDSNVMHGSVNLVVMIPPAHATSKGVRYNRNK